MPDYEGPGESACYTAEALLAAREERAARINQLCRHYQKPLLAVRVNYPGLKKTNPMTLQIVQDISDLLQGMLGPQMIFHSLVQGPEGPVFLAVADEEASVLKRRAVVLEERHALGRCLDIDVYDVWGRSLSRREMGLPERTCYLCEAPAHHCVRTKRHREEDVIAYINERFRLYVNSGSNTDLPLKRHCRTK